LFAPEAVTSPWRGVCVVIQPAPSLVHARLVTAIAEIEGEFTEGHQLDAKLIRKIPKNMLGKRLSSKQAGQLALGARDKKETNRNLATPARFELATPGLGNQCSIQLSYGAFLASHP
jgi:hypothetical protein